jgi:transcriptional regulator with XRE-family HTH domain
MWQRARGAVGLGSALRRLREARGWTQSDLAELLGVDRTTVIRLEAGRNPAVRRLVDALSLLGADLLVVPRGARVTVEQPEQDLSQREAAADGPA